MRQKGRLYQDASTYDNPPAGKRRQTRWKDGGMVEQLSFALPQRYFFNIARVPCLKLNASLENGWREPERLAAHARNSADFCKCPACIGLVNVIETNDSYVVSWQGKSCRFDAHWISAGNSAGNWKKNVLLKVNKCGNEIGEESLCDNPVKFRQAVALDVGGVGALISFCRRTAVVEAMALLLWCIFYSAITLILLKTRRQFNELR